MDLFTYVAQGHTIGDENLCHALFYQIINSLNFLHKDCGLAHLDIKLENIVLDARYLLKLIDFAYCEPKRTMMSVSKGTERYFAPEVARIFYKRQEWFTTNEGGADQQNGLKLWTYVAEEADIFSLGILLFTMYFGQPPFH